MKIFKNENCCCRNYRMKNNFEKYNFANEKIVVGKTFTTNSNTQAKVVDQTGSPNHLLEFYIPQGKNGINGTNGKDGTTPTIGVNGDWFIDGIDTGKVSRGATGLKGDKGDTGEKGDNGESDTIEIGTTTTGLPGTNALVVDNQQTGHHILNFTIPRGDAGLEKINEGYFDTLNVPELNIPATGLEIASGARLPIKRLEMQTSNLFVLDQNDNTIQFNKTGAYEVIFSINGYVKKTSTDFDPTTDFVSVGFRAVDGEIVYAGANDWSYNPTPKNIIGLGTFMVESIVEPFELVNLQKKPLYITGGTIGQTITHSYFSCPVVTILIKKLN